MLFRLSIRGMRQNGWKDLRDSESIHTCATHLEKEMADPTDGEGSSNPDSWFVVSAPATTNRYIVCMSNNSNCAASNTRRIRRMCACVRLTSSSIASHPSVQHTLSLSQPALDK